VSGDPARPVAQFLGSGAHDVWDLFGFTSIFRVIFLLCGKCGVKVWSAEIGIKASLKEGLVHKGNWSSGMILA
jgi:hypothetical protein